jgi:hypothetical protein
MMGSVKAGRGLHMIAVDFPDWLSKKIVSDEKRIVSNAFWGLKRVRKQYYYYGDNLFRIFRLYCKSTNKESLNKFWVK